VTDDVPVDSETLLETEFVNLKIKSSRSFRCAHRGRVYVCVHRNEYSYVYKYLCFTVFLKNIEGVIILSI
jgi:hypothetical protein